MGKIRRGGFVFVTWIGDHGPYHVHVYLDQRLVVKWDLENDSADEGRSIREGAPIDRRASRGRSALRITSVADRPRERALEIATEQRSYPFPYPKLRVVPSAEDPIVEIRPDPELGNEAFTYRLRSGTGDTVHLDAVLDANSDPDYLQGVLLHQLTVEAIRGLEESRLGKRQVARQLGTSASQLYRLLDPANTNKSLGQLLALLNLVGRDVEVVVGPKGGRGTTTRGPVGLERLRERPA